MTYIKYFMCFSFFHRVTHVTCKWCLTLHKCKSYCCTNKLVDTVFVNISLHFLVLEINKVLTVKLHWQTLQSISLSKVIVPTGLYHCLCYFNSCPTSVQSCQIPQLKFGGKLYLMVRMVIMVLSDTVLLTDVQGIMLSHEMKMKVIRSFYHNSKFSFCI